MTTSMARQEPGFDHRSNRDYMSRRMSELVSIAGTVSAVLRPRDDSAGCVKCAHAFKNDASTRGGKSAWQIYIY